jgi:hypothetical protein
MKNKYTKPLHKEEHMKNKIENLSMSKTGFILELFNLPIDYLITVGEMKELCDTIIQEAGRRGLTLHEKEVVTFLRRQWCQAQTQHLVQYEIAKTNFGLLIEKEKEVGLSYKDSMRSVYITFRRNVRRLIKRRGKRETKQYLRKLIKDYPDNAAIFERTLRELE